MEWKHITKKGSYCVFTELDVIYPNPKDKSAKPKCKCGEPLNYAQCMLIDPVSYGDNPFDATCETMKVWED